jgi:hypothetical protein
MKHSMSNINILKKRRIGLKKPSKIEADYFIHEYRLMLTAS